MDVLIVDDEPMMRALLRKVIARDLGCAVTEAADGLEALNALTEKAFTFVVTDLHMPLMDGIELLDAIRQSPERGATPVVLMTTDRDQRVVQKAIALGVSDYLIKPLDPRRVSARLSALLAKLSRMATANGLQPAAADATTSYVIADGSADFRQFFVSALGPARKVHEAETGVAALQRTVELKPGALFVGSQLGLLEPGRLARKVRSMPALDGVKLYAIVTRAPGEAVERMEPFDDVLARSFDVEIFRQQVARVVGLPAAGGVLSSLFRLCEDLTSAADQAFGMVLGMDIRTALERAALAAPEGFEVLQSLELAGAGERLVLSMRANPDAARQMAAAMQRVDAERLPSDDPGRVMKEMAGLVTDRLRTTLVSAGFQVTCEPASFGTYTNEPTPGAASGLYVTGRSADGVPQFLFHLASVTA
jgi:CheY-like chemotaxis protein